MEVASGATMVARPPVAMTRQDRSSSCSIRWTKASTRPAYPNSSPDWMLLAVSVPMTVLGRTSSTLLSLAARASALLDDRDFATPDDVKSVALDVLRHRILLSYEAEADRVSVDEVIREILGSVRTP